MVSNFTSSLVSTVKSYLRNHQLLVLVFLIASIVKLYFISNDFIYFWYDQARDAAIARSILEQGDIKLQGPSASGTNDQIYHGVLYFYFIAPLYTFSGGSPRFVSTVIAVLTSFFVFPVFHFVKNISDHREVGLITAFLTTVCIDTITTGVWLSNPMLLLVIAPSFYWLLWRVLIDGKTNLIWLLALTLGLANQAAISSVYLFIPLGAVYLFQAAAQKKIFLWNWQQYLTFIAVYAAAISTMILSQLKLYLQGIFSFETLSESAHVAPSSVLLTVDEIFTVYLHKIELSLLPNLPYVSLVIFLAGLVVYLFKVNNKQRYFYLTSFLAVAAFLMLHFRDSHHGLIGLTPIILIPVAYSLYQLISSRRPLFRGLAGLILILYSLYHANVIRVNRKHSYFEYTIQNEFMLRDQLALIDKTYQLASGSPFSITTLTIPYSWNTTWGYLYDWYGHKNYGYKPHFFGFSQAGVFGEEYLEETNRPRELHFTIYEPNVGVAEPIMDQFLSQQRNAGPVVHSYYFSGLKLEQRRPLNISLN